MRPDMPSRLAPALLLALVAVMVILAVVLLVEASPHILPDVGAAVEQVSGY